MKSTATDQSKKIAQILFDIGAVTFSRSRPFKFDSGILSPVYVDNRILISYPKQRNIILNYLLVKIKELGKIDVIAGVATAGIPHAAFIAQKLNLPMVFVRAKPKDHGKGNQVEGKLRRGQKVLVIEDLVSTAGSSVRVIEAIRRLGGIVTDELAIYSHSLKASDRNFKEAKVNFYHLTDTMSAAQVAKEKGFLKDEQIESILSWTKDPQSWAKKMGYE